MTDTPRPDPAYFLTEAAAYCGMTEGAFRIAYYRRKQVMPDGKVSGHPFWKQSTLDAYKVRRAEKAIIKNGTVYYPSVAVAKRLGMTRAAFSYWMKHEDGRWWYDVRIEGRPYFTEHSIEVLTNLRRVYDNHQTALRERREAR